MIETVKAAFRKAYGTEPAAIVRAPGRVNLIGEHTDYNDGFVLPMAINRAVWIALEPVDGNRVEAFSVDYGESASFDLDSLEKGDHGWIEYVKGVAWALSDVGNKLGGWRGAIAGDVPLGAGLSSSAALEMAVGRAFETSSEFTIGEADLAKLGQLAENKWIGVNCGIMDQLISSAGREGHAMLIDCRSLELTPSPLPEETCVVILDTATRRGLEGSAYNERRSQCETGAAHFGVEKLRDLTLEQFEARASELDELVRRRCRHVISENERTMLAAEKMREDDAAAFGELMNASHVSLRDDFEVSSKELDIMAEVAQASPGCIGARMTGAGFGGCAVALVKAGASEKFVAAVEKEYEARTSLRPNIYVCTPTDGARVVESAVAEIE